MRLVCTQEFEKVKQAYIDVINHTDGIYKHSKWEYGWHPHDKQLQNYINHGEMFLLEDGDKVAAVVVITMYQEGEYQNVAWKHRHKDNEVAVLHLLAVCPAYQGKGTSQVFLTEIEKFVRKCGKKAIRLDTFAINLPAQKTYERYGYTMVERRTVNIHGTFDAEEFFYELDLSVG